MITHLTDDGWIMCGLVRSKKLDTIAPEVYAILFALAKGGADVDPIKLCPKCRRRYLKKHGGDRR